MVTDPLLLIHRSLSERVAVLHEDRDGYLARVHAERDVLAARRATPARNVWPWLRRLLRVPRPLPDRFWPLAAYTAACGRGYSDREHAAMRVLRDEYERWRLNRRTAGRIADA